MNLRNVFAYSVPLLLASCAHTFMRGTVAMKINDREAHVCLGDDAVKTGDRVAFFVNRCRGNPRNEGGCDLVKIGEGKVVRLLNRHYSVVEADAGIKLDEGAMVQKL